MKPLTGYIENDLIAQWIEGDDKAFEKIYKHYSIQLLRVALNKTGNRETAQELTQETFINLYQNKEAISKSVNIQAYLYVILKNKIINHYRKSLTHQKYTDFLSLQPSPSVTAPDQYVEARELEANLREAIEKLPTQCKAVFKLSREQYLSDKEIAAELNISVNTVEQHKRKALRILRGTLGSLISIAAIDFLLTR